MKRSRLIAWLLTMGGALWLSGLVVDGQPTYAVVAVIASLLLGAFAATPYRT